MDKERLFQILAKTCAWCNRQIPPGADVFGFGARLVPGIDLTGKDGQFVSLDLGISHKTVVALVPVEESSAWKDGYGLVFITCNQKCAQDLKAALQLEKDVFEDYPGN